MLETVMKYEIIFYSMAILMVIGVVGKLFSYFTTNKLVKSASDIQKSNQRLMKLIKAKFEHASMVSDRVQNVEAFVQKYLYEYKVLGMRLNSWHNFSLKLAWIIVAVGVLGVVFSYRFVGMVEQTFRYGAFAAVYAVVLISMHILSDEKMKLKAIQNYMVEYLENVCVHRYEKANHVAKMLMETPANEELKEQEKEVEADIEEKLSVELTQKAEVVPEEKLENAKEDETKKEREEQEMRIRAILQEFLA